MLNKEEKDELLALAGSSQMRRDFQIVRTNHAMNLKNADVGLDNYIEFLTFSNFFANHNQRPFKKIKGDNFKI